MLIRELCRFNGGPKLLNLIRRVDSHPTGLNHCGQLILSGLSLSHIRLTKLPQFFNTGLPGPKLRFLAETIFCASPVPIIL